MSPLVIQSSIGPYDYAVLKADSKDAMLKWLSDNHYFVPAGTDETVSAYLHPGAYFLALKLKSGKSAGDLQPSSGTSSNPPGGSADPRRPSRRSSSSKDGKGIPGTGT